MTMDSFLEEDEIPIHKVASGFCLLPFNNKIIQVLSQSAGSTEVFMDGKSSRVSRNTGVIPVSAGDAARIQKGRAQQARSPENISMSKSTTKSTAPKANASSAVNPYADERVYSAETKKKFNDQVDKKGKNECWPWKGRKTGPSGAFFPFGKELRINKLAYLYANEGADPEGRYVSTCKESGAGAACCNGAHIVPSGGTPVNKPKAAAKSVKPLDAPIPQKVSAKAEKNAPKQDAEPKELSVELDEPVKPKKASKAKAKVATPAPTSSLKVSRKSKTASGKVSSKS